MRLAPLRMTPADIKRAQAGALRRPRPIDVSTTVCARLERVITDRPHSVALCHGTERLTFLELTRMVAVLRARLAERGCGHGDVVAALGTRGPETLALFLALESLGAIYLPLEAAWPARRVQTILADAQVGLLVAYG